MAKGFTGVTMPGDIALDPVQSEIWRELAPDGNNRFTEQDVPALRLLCYWHAVARQAQEAIARGDGRISIFDRVGTKPYKAPDGKSVPLMRKNPALSVLKEASAEIRALSDQLGVSPRFRVSAQVPEKPKSGKAELLELAIAGGGRRRAARA